MQNNNYELISLAKNGDELAKEQLVCENSRLIYSVARRFLGRGYDLEDLYQLGAIGLIKAINNFDIEYNVQFSTYAVPLIMGEIKRFLRDDGIIKVSRSQKTLAAKAKAVEEKLRTQTGEAPKISEIAEKLSVSCEEIAAAIEASKPVESLLAPSSEDEKLLLIDKISGGVNNENDTVNKITLFELVKKLPERERKIIFLRYFKDKTQTQTAKKLGISQVQVSRIEKKILGEMRKKMI